MNNEIQKFDFKGAPLRTLTDKAGEPWFVAKDVCDILGTDTRDLHKILESDEITNVDSIHIAQNGGKAPLIISEPGLYRLVMKSRKPEAKEFQRWVTHEVLPSIRKHGGYIAGQEELSPQELMAKALLVAQKTLTDRDARIKELTAQNQIMQPKAEYFDELVARNLLTNFRETAKELGIKEKYFVVWLLEHKYIYRDQKNKLMPYAA